MKNFRLNLSFFFTILCTYTATAQWEYFTEIPESYHYNMDLTELDNGYFALVGWEINPISGGPFLSSVTVVDADGQEVFTRVFEEIIFDVYSVLPAPEGLYLIGTKKMDISSSTRMVVIKLNYENQIEWETTYNKAVRFSPKWIDAILSSDTTISIIFSKRNEITGNSDSTGLLKIALDGTLLSSITIEAGKFHIHRSMTLAEDGNLLITGKISDSIYLQKINMAGEEIWKKAFYLMSFFDGGKEIVIADDGQIMLMGWQYEGEGLGGTLGKTILIKIDNDGNLLWETTYVLAANTEARDFCKMDDGGFIFIGRLGHDDTGPTRLFMTKIDSEGAIVWRKSDLFTSEDIAFKVLGSNIIKTTGNYVVISGNVAESDLNLYLSKIDVGGIVKTQVPTSLISAISLSPVPTSATLHIDLTLKKQTELSIEIMNLTGQIVDRVQTTAIYEEGFHRIDFNTSKLINGFYQIVVRTVNGSELASFIKI